MQVTPRPAAPSRCGEIANALNGAVLSNYASTLSCAGASLSSGGSTSGTFTMPDNDVLCTLTNTRRAAVADFTTYTQGGWGAPPNGNNPGALLKANFATVYPSGVTIGGTKTLKFTSAAAIEALPAGRRQGGGAGSVGDEPDELGRGRLRGSGARAAAQRRLLRQGHHQDGARAP